MSVGQACDPSQGEPGVGHVLERIRAQLDLDAETEYELLEELRATPALPPGSPPPPRGCPPAR